MKYGDEAWTEPEPAGFDTGEWPTDPRLRDKAYGAPPAGGFLTVGGTPDDVALPDGRLPPGHSPAVPVAPTIAITTPGGAVDEAAVITLTGDFPIGSYCDVLRDCSAEPEPTGAPYAARSSMSAAAFADGWANYLNFGVGFTATADNGVITLTPDPGESIALSLESYNAPAPLTSVIGTAGGDDVTPAVITNGGTAQPGDQIDVSLTTDEGDFVVTYIAQVTISMLLGSNELAAEINKVVGAEGGSKNFDTLVYAADVGGAVTITDVTVTLAP